MKNYLRPLVKKSPVLLAVLCCVAACSQAPVYQRPATAVTGEFKSPLLWKQSEPDSNEPSLTTQWWTLFNDETLNNLQQQVEVNNQTLKANAAQLKTAQAALEAARAPLLPSLTINAGASRSANSFNSPRGTSYSFNGAAANWEIDLWGRLSGQVDAAQASFQASELTLAAARLSVHAAVVQTYFALRFAQAQADLLDRSVQVYRKSLELTQNRYESGVATRSDVALAVAQLKSAQSQYLSVKTQTAQLENALAGFAGRAMAGFNLAQNSKMPTLPTVPALLQSSWLERRPDIAAAERQVAAANFQVGATRAAFFPTLTLSASGGYRGPSLSDLIAAPNQVWSIGPLLSYAAFDNGLRRAANAQALASLELTTANYRQTVLTALQELEDNLVATYNLREQVELLSQAKAASQEVLRIAMNQYQAGTVSYFNVVTAQTNALNTELAWLNLQNLQFAATNTLLKNTAGALPEDKVSALK